MKKNFTHFILLLIITLAGHAILGQQHDLLPRHRIQSDFGNAVIGSNAQGADAILTENILLNEDFSGDVFPPEGWAVVGDGTDNWVSYDGNYAGGQAPEASFTYSPIFEGTSRLATVEVNTAGISSLTLEFKHFLNDYVGDYTLKVESTSDGETWNEVWSVYVPAGNGNIGPDHLFTGIDNSDVGSETFQLAFIFEGNSDNIDYWFIDDVVLKETPQSDVAPIALQGIGSVQGIGVELSPAGTVINYGAETAGFDVNLRINDGSTDIYTSTKTVSNLAFLEETDLEFDPWTTSAEGEYVAYLTTSLEGDEKPENDELTFSFVVMDGVLLYEDFVTGMGDWSVVGDGTTNWGINQSAYAGGTTPEVMMYYFPLFDGTSRLVSPPVNTAGQTDLSLQFKHFLNNYTGGFNLKVETSSDGTTWNEIWSIMDVQGDIGPELIVSGINNTDVGSETFQLAFTFDGNSDLVDYWYIDDIILRVPPQKDVTALGIDGFNPLMAVGIETTPTTRVKNLAASSASFDVNITVNNGTEDVFTSTVSVSDLGGYEETEVTFDNWTTVEGNMTATVTTLLEGDENPLNDQAIYEFTVINGVFRNYVLIEDATGAWCGFCPGAAMGCDDLLHNGWDVAVIAYHNGDNYATPESDARIDYYDIQGFPTVVFGGVQQISGGSATASMYSYYVPVVEERLELPTPIKLDLENVVFSDGTVTADAIIEKVSLVPEGDIVLHAVLTESHIDEAWQTMFEMNHAERLMFNGAEGTPVDFSSQDQHTVNVSFNLDETWVPELCELVVFVQHVSSREVFNADKAEVKAIEKYADVTVTVKDNKGQAIEEALVKFGEHDLVTDANGEAMLADAKPGVYAYTAQKEGYLPGPMSNVVVRIEDKSLEVALIKANVLFAEDFLSDVWPPEGWTQTGDTSTNWLINESNYAGGVSPELYFSWYPVFDGTTNFDSPEIDISDKSNASIILKHRVDDYQGENYSMHILASTDGAEWESVWDLDPPVDIDAEVLILPLDEKYIAAGKVFVRFQFTGNTDYTNSWAIDDVWVIEEIVTHNLTFNVTDLDGGDPIENAVVQIIGLDNVETDADGLASFTAIEDGAYAYTVTADDYVEVTGNINMSGADHTEYVEMQTTGIDEALAAKVKIYPNPAKNAIWIDNLDKATIKLYSITGKLLLTEEDVTGKKQIDLSHLQNGNYILLVTENDAVMTSKISVAK
jgi:hypothetical protein